MTDIHIIRRRTSFKSWFSFFCSARLLAVISAGGFSFLAGTILADINKIEDQNDTTLLNCRKTVVELMLQKAYPSEELASTYEKLGQIFCNLEIYDSAVWYYQQALETRHRFAPDDNRTAEVYLTLGNIYLLHHKEIAAVAMFQRALDIFEWNYSPEHEIIITIVNQIACIYFKNGYYDLSEKYHQKALKLKIIRYGDKHVEVAVSLHALANIYFSLGRLDEAESYQLEALAIFKNNYGYNNEFLLNVYDDLVLIYIKQHCYEKAQRYLDKCYEIINKLPACLDSTVGLIYNLSAILSQEKGDFKQSVKMYEKSLAYLNNNSHSEELYKANIYYNIARLFWQLGNLDTSVLYIDKALEIWREKLGTEHPEWATGYRSLAGLYIEMGRYIEAESMLVKVLTIIENKLGTDHEETAWTYQQLGGLYQSQHRFEKAAQLYEKALCILIYKYGADDIKVINLMGNLAITYTNLNNIDGAESLCRMVRHILSRKVDKSPSIANALFNLAWLAQTKSDYFLADSLYLVALETYHKIYGNIHPRLALTLVNMAIVNTFSGQYDKADSLFQIAYKMYQQYFDRSHLRIAELLIHYGYLKRMLKEEEKAVTLSYESYSIRKDMFNDNVRVLPEDDLPAYSVDVRKAADYFISSYQDLKSHSQSYVKLAASVVLASKNQVFDEIYYRRNKVVVEPSINTKYLWNKMDLAKKQLSHLYELLEEKYEQGVFYRIDSLKKEIKQSESVLAGSCLKFQEGFKFQNVNIERLIDEIPQNSLLIEYYRYNYIQLPKGNPVPYYLAVVINDDGEINIINIGPADEIDSLVFEYQEHMSRLGRQTSIPSQSEYFEYKFIAKNIFKRVLAPIESYFKDKYLLLISPDGLLNIISFASLIDNDEQYMVEKHPVHYLSTGRDIIRYSESRNINCGIVVFGNPDYNAKLNNSLISRGICNQVILSSRDNYDSLELNHKSIKKLFANPLPGTAKEIEQVIELINNASDPVYSFTDTMATESNFKKYAPGKRIIHLATHGFYSDHSCGSQDIMNNKGEYSLISSGLLFAGANHSIYNVSSYSADDGILTAYEVSNMNLEGTALVVLSACRSGLGYIENGEGVYGFIHAFQLAGVQTIISTLWDISDETAPMSVKNIYTDGFDTWPERLRYSQLKQLERLRTSNLPDHPYSWASFIVTGNWKD